MADRLRCRMRRGPPTGEMRRRKTLVVGERWRDDAADQKGGGGRESGNLKNANEEKTRAGWD